MKRHEVTDDHWDAIRPILPKRTAKTGRPASDPRLMLNGILWILRTGAPWRDLPERFGPWQTVYDHFARWRKAGVYDRILESLHIRLDAEGEFDWDLWCMMVRRCGPPEPRPMLRKKLPSAPGRAERPRFGPLARRIRQQVPSGY